MNLKRLNDVVPDWKVNGIFTALQGYDVPWKSENMESTLDLLYHGNRSGQKIISPIVESILSDDYLTDVDLNALAVTAFKVYGKNWAKMWETLSFEYNPIENYSMVEQMTNDETVTEYGRTTTRTNNLSHMKTGTETDTPNTTETTTPNLTNTTNTGVHGFNSSESVPTGTESQTATGTNQVSRTGTDTTTYNTTDADTGTQTDADTGTDTHTRNYSLTRSGNIGVTTSQQMIQSERDLWKWNYFTDVVFPDLDKLLTICIY